MYCIVIARLKVVGPNLKLYLEIGVLVKSIDLPKFTVDVKDLNQYNRHTYIQDRIKYEPITSELVVEVLPIPQYNIKLEDINKSNVINVDPNNEIKLNFNKIF